MRQELRAIPDVLRSFERRSLVLAAVASSVALAALFVGRESFFRSYLVAYLFWLGISLGCLSLLMLQHLSGGSWGIVIRRLLESGARTVPLMAALFLPLLLGLHHLYEWTHPELVQADSILREKSAYLNVPFFVVRAVLYFSVWSGLSIALARLSHAQDRGSDPKATQRMQSLSGPGLVLIVLTVSFASVDWVMSLDPHWYSTIFGALLLAGQALSALSFAIAVVVLLKGREPLRSAVSPSHLHDLGKLLLAFVMVWAYFAFSQFLIVWAGNLTEEIPWYLRRIQGGWQWLALLLVLGQFVLPFVLLLSRDLKRDQGALLKVAALVIGLRLVDATWLVVPAFDGAGVGTLVLAVAQALALGGIWLAVFFRGLGRHPLLPIGDPLLEEALAHGRH